MMSRMTASQSSPSARSTPSVPVCAALTIIYSTGIILFHRHNGFFVVGPGTGGWEYSALLITCLVVTAWEHVKQKSPVR